MTITNHLTAVATPLVDMPLFLGFTALIAIANGFFLFRLADTTHWGSNRMLYVLSGGNPKIGGVLGLVPSIAFFLLGCYQGARALGFL